MPFRPPFGIRLLVNTFGNAIDIKGLVKHYKNTHALQGVDLAIREGEFFGLLGPNGAGKTTLINAIMGLVRPGEGSIAVMGHDVRENPSGAKQYLGLSPQEINIHAYYPIGKLIEYQGGYYGLPRKEALARAEMLLKRFGLWEKRKVGRYSLSGGMQRRLMIARALTGKPKVLILDEPTAGIDVELRHELWSLLKQLNQDGTTILLTTHYIEEAEMLCDRVGIIHEGKIKAIDTPKHLIEQHQLTGGEKKRADLKYTRPGTLEEVFVALTGKEISEGGNECEVRPALSL